MIEKLFAAELDHRSAGSEERSVREIVMRETDPRIEEKVKGHRPDHLRLRLRGDSGGDVEADRGLDGD